MNLSAEREDQIRQDNEERLLRKADSLSLEIKDLLEEIDRLRLERRSRIAQLRESLDRIAHIGQRTK